ALANLGFTDIAIDAKLEDEGKPTVVTAETFDSIVYKINLVKRKSGDDYLAKVSVTGEPPSERPPEKGEKAEETERRNKDFAESRKRLEARVAREKALAGSTYLVEAKQVAPLIK